MCVRAYTRERDKIKGVVAQKGGKMAGSSNSFRQMRMDHLFCRMIGHPWMLDETEIRNFKRRGQKGAGVSVRELKLRCSRCGAARNDVFHRTTSDLIDRSYEHAKGYLIKNVKPWSGRKEFNRNVKRELLSRL